MHGHETVGLGVKHFGKTGTIQDLYSHFGINRDSIVKVMDRLSPNHPLRAVSWSMEHRFWHHYTAHDFAARDRVNLIVILPVIAIKQHGSHLPLSVDQAILDGVIAHTLPHLTNDLPALFLPKLPVGKSTKTAHGPAL